MINQEYASLPVLAELFSIFNEKPGHKNDQIMVEINYEPLISLSDIADIDLKVAIVGIDSYISKHLGNNVMVISTLTYFDDEMLETCSNGKGVMVHQFFSLILNTFDESNAKMPRVEIEHHDGSIEKFYNKSQLDRIRHPNRIIKRAFFMVGDDTDCCKIYLRTY